MSVEERDAASSVIAAEVIRLVADARTVALYAAKGSEVATGEIDRRLRARGDGVRVVYPRVDGAGRKLSFAAAQVDDLVAAPRFGLREPHADADAVEIASIDAFVVPGLAFDRDGARIGWGRGHYDATLVDAPDAVLIGLAFACQMVDRIDADPHDVALDYVVTEVATHVIGG